VYDGAHRTSGVLDRPTGENLNAVDVDGDAIVVGAGGTVLRR